MSTSLLYHAFGAINYNHMRTEYLGGKVIFSLAKKPEKQRCAVCKSRKVTREGGRDYQWQTVPIGSKPVILKVHLKRLLCWACGAKRQELRELAEPRKSYTRQLARYVLELSECMTLADIAAHLKLDWHLVHDIVKSSLERKEKRRSWRGVSMIAIDEISVRKGHRYMTVVVDLETGQVLDVVEGRKTECLEPVFKRLKRAGAKLKAVAMDMSPAFRKAVRNYAPKEVVIVHDPFHVVQAVNRATDQVRKMEQARLDPTDKKYIKGNRFLLLKGWENLEADEQKVNRLEQMLGANENLYRAYLLKEDLRLFWSQDNKVAAERFLQIWIEEARCFGLKPFKTLAKTLNKRKDELLAWYDFPITNGPLEGLNNKIKVLKRRAYGYRNMKSFRLRILFIHETTFRLTGT